MNEWVGALPHPCVSALLPLFDTACVQPYSATDHTKYGGKTAGKKCPAEGYCMNCMPIKVRVLRCEQLCTKRA